MRISQTAKRAILKYVNNVDNSLLISNEVFTELSNNTAIRPDVPIVLYRGIRFNNPADEKLFKNDVFNTGGKVFSSWTYSKESAMRFARFGPNASKTSHYINMFHASMRGNSLIDGMYGIIIKKVFLPEQVLVDIKMIPNKISFGFEDEGEVLIKESGEINSYKIVNIITKDKVYDSCEDFMNRPVWIFDYIDKMIKLLPELHKYKKLCVTFQEYMSNLDPVEYTKKDIRGYDGFKDIVKGNELIKSVKSEYTILNDVSYLHRYNMGVYEISRLSHIVKLLNDIEAFNELISSPIYTSYHYKQQFKFLKNLSEEEVDIFMINISSIGNNIFLVGSKLSYIIDYIEEIKTLIHP